MQQYRDQTRLPVVAMDDLRMETNDRHHGKHCLAEEGEALDIPAQIRAVRGFAVEVELVVHEIELDAVELIFHDADMLLTAGVVHIEMVPVMEEIAVSARNTGVIRDDDTHIKAFLIKILRQCADNVSQTAGLDKRHTFGSSKQNVGQSKSLL